VRSWPAPVLGLLDLVEAINQAAYATYTWGWRRPQRARVPVVSVGNIAMGGTGKTPLVAALSRALLAAGRRPAILTRGYRRRRRDPLVVWRRPDVPWEEAGDEPALLARALPEVPIIVDSDRVRGAETAVARTGADVLLLDDGFQHWRLARDLDIVTVEAGDPVGARAPRREHPDALARADAVVLSRTANRTEALAAMAVLGPYAPNAYLMATTLAARAVHSRGERLPADVLRGVNVLAMAGIASPDGFVGSLGDLGAHLHGLKLFPDHHRYRRGELVEVLAQADAADAVVVTTGKDIVKLPADISARVMWLEVESVAMLGSFEELLARVLVPPSAPRSELESRS
jgi:tetraacyldisaccharide 4'-kinase